MSIGQHTFPYRLMTPGPVPLSPEVREALARPMIHHRTPEFVALFNRTMKGLSWMFSTTQPVLSLCATGSGAMEAALVNVLSPGDEVLSIISGKFGERWAEMAERSGVKVHRLHVQWGYAVLVTDVQRELDRLPAIKAVLCQACETSTATIHPIREIAKLVANRPQTLMIVDAITALGAMPLLMDDWHLDVVVAGSQKAFMLPTGLAFIALSEKAWRANSTAKIPRFYFDLLPEKKAQAKGQTVFSSAVSHIVALDVALTQFQKLGLSGLIRRCEILAQATREGGADLGLSVFSKQPSAAVTALLTPAKVDGARLRDHLEAKYNITVMGGQDQLTGKILRIGHLGYITNDDAIATLECIGLSLKDLGCDDVTDLKIAAATNKVRQILAQKP